MAYSITLIKTRMLYGRVVVITTDEVTNPPPKKTLLFMTITIA